jgi:hypothetical protein
VNSWRNSLRAVSQVFQEGELLHHGVILEFQLPLTSRRLDCLITGRNDWSRENSVVVELKQWDKCQDGGGRNELATWVGGGLRDLLHPSAQVGQYRTYLEDAHTAFDREAGIQLNACSYLHNYSYDPSDYLADRRLLCYTLHCSRVAIRKDCAFPSNSVRSVSSVESEIFSLIPESMLCENHLPIAFSPE